MLFEEAFQIMRDGAKASRKSWTDYSARYIALGEHDGLPSVIVVWTSTKYTDTFVPTSADLLADDWDIVSGE